MPRPFAQFFPSALPAVLAAAGAAWLSSCGGPTSAPEEEDQVIEIETGYRGAARMNPFLAAERFLQEMGLDSAQQYSLTEMPETDIVLVVPAQEIRAAGAANRLLEWVKSGGHLIYLLEGGDSLEDDWPREEVRQKLREFRSKIEAEKTETNPRESNEAETNPAPENPGDSDLPASEIEPTETKSTETPPEEPKSTSSPEQPKDEGEEEPKKDEENEKTELEKIGLFDSEDEESFPLLKKLTIEINNRPEALERLEIGGQLLEVDIPPGRGFDVPSWHLGAIDTIRSGDEKAEPFVSFDYFQEGGRLTFLADAHPWRNRYLPANDHARFLWEVANLHGEVSGVWIMRSTRADFFQLLWRYGRMPLLSLLVLLVFWLWRTMPRFGPIRPAAAAASREFTSHLAMAGQFIGRRGSPLSLVKPIRRRILRRYRSKVLNSGEDPIEIAVSELTVSTGLSEKRIRNALKSQTFNDNSQTIAVLRDLQKLDRATHEL